MMMTTIQHAAPVFRGAYRDTYWHCRRLAYRSFCLSKRGSTKPINEIASNSYTCLPCNNARTLRSISSISSNNQKVQHLEQYSQRWHDQHLHSTNSSHFRYFSTSQKITDNNLPIVDPKSDDTTIEPYKPIDLSVAAKIEGEESHVVIVDLQPGEALRAEAGALVYMTDGVLMTTSLQGASNAFKRFMTGQNVFLTDYTYQGESGTKGVVCLGTDFPSKILRFNLQTDIASGCDLICQRGAYLASNPTINIEMEFTKSLSAGFFGGQGFILQKLSGQGDVLVKGGGTIVQRELKAGETLRVSSGSIVAFESSINYDVQMMPGIKNAMFGGEGLFITTLTGPGRVWLQGMPPDRMIAEIARRVPGPGIGLGIPIGGMGGGGGGTSDEGNAGDGAGDDAAAAASSGAVGGGEAVSNSDSADQVAASDAAIEADRQATVATSGAMGDGNADASAADLFGDAAGSTSSPPSSDDNIPGAAPASDDDDWSTASSSSNTETTFGDDDNDFSNDNSFQNETSFGKDDFSSDFGNDNNAQDGELFDDTGASSEPTSDNSGDSGGGIFSTLWDMFMGGNDDEE